jgi:hypothetical protein
MKTLGVTEADAVDLRFETKDRTIWKTAFSFEQASRGLTDEERDIYERWPPALSVSLRRYFRVERPFQPPLQVSGPIKVPEGWGQVVKSRAGLARLHGTAADKPGTLVWIAASDYSVRFRDLEGNQYFGADRLDDERGLILEYVGISLRVYRRSGLRYRGD